MRLKKTIVGALTSILLLGMAGIPQTQAATSIANDPGPVGDFAWNGFNWQKRFWAGGPMYNGNYSINNVSNPDVNGYVTLNLSNSTGNAPSAAEFQSTRRGFGYGTYTTTVEKNINSLQTEVVWGCLFTYDPDSPPGMNEIDLCEASAWGGGASYGQEWPVTQGHGYWFDATKAPGVGNNTVVFNATDAPILTHKMVWEPGKITFETYAGSGYTGTLLKRTVLQGSTVPIPAKERVVFNLWVTGGGGGDPAHVKPEKVVIRNFSFTPAAAVPTISIPTPTASNISYAGHVENIGWQASVLNGEIAGTTGRGLRLEAFRFTSTGQTARAHVQNIGWQDYRSGASTIGTSGQSLRMEAVQVKSAVAGEAILCQAHVENVGWMTEVSDGEVCGTTGKGLRLEAVRLRVVTR